MMRTLVLATLFGLVGGAALAQTPPPAPKADCALFKKTSDGRWTSVVDSKIGNPKQFVTLQKGKPIEKDMAIFGMNVSDTIDKLCGK